MEAWFLYAGIAMCLFALGAIGQRDWTRMRTLSRQTEGEVVGHRIMRDEGRPTYAAVYRFSAEGAEHEVVDQVYGRVARPPLGTRVQLNYPVGRPDLARVPRPLMWSAVYLVLVYLLGVLVAKAMGWLH